MIEKDFIEKVISQIQKDAIEKNTDRFSKTRDIFEARLQTFISRTSKYMESALIGEIGNNTFDHNLDYVEGMPRGLYWNSEFEENTVILADFGRGVRKSLENVVKTESDVESLKMAFKEHISGRSTEKRGDGLKFILDEIKLKNWQFYFQSGNGCCFADKNDVQFTETEKTFFGSFAIIKFLEG